MAEVRTGDYITGNIFAFRLDETPELIVFEGRGLIEPRGAANQLVLHESEVEAIIRAYQQLPPRPGRHLTSG